MAIRKDYIGNTGNNLVKQTTPELLGNMKVKKEQVIDLAVLNSVSGDVIEAINVPAGAFVSRVGVLILTEEDTTLTATVGDGDAAAGWKDAVDLEDATGGDHSGPMYTSDLDEGTDSYGEGKYYAAADTIDLTMSANAGDTGKFVVWAEMHIMETQAA